MSEAFSPSMEEIGETCVAYDSGMSEASSNSAITQEQNVADSGVRALPHGESSYSISQKWAEVGAEETTWNTSVHIMLGWSSLAHVYVYPQ